MGEPEERPTTLKTIRGDRLLSIQDVSEITGLCRRVASGLMDESGQALVLGTKKYVFETAFYDFLKGKANGGAR